MAAELKKTGVGGWGVGQISKSSEGHGPIYLRLLPNKADKVNSLRVSLKKQVLQATQESGGDSRHIATAGCTFLSVLCGVQE